MSGEIFGQLLDSLETARDAGGIKRALKSFTAGLGFDWFAYLSARGSDVQALSSYPWDWQRHYLDRGFAEIDPVVQRARQQQEGFGWSNDSFGSRASPDEYHFFGEAIEYGIRSGISVPVVGGFGRFALLTLASPGRHDEYLLQQPNVATSIAVRVDAHVRRCAVAEPFSPDAGLTQRELTCLRWAAEGKRMAEIAQIIGTAERTVEFHLENARHKLGAVNLTHATALATRRNLI